MTREDAKNRAMQKILKNNHLIKPHASFAANPFENGKYDPEAYSLMRKANLLNS